MLGVAIKMSICTYIICLLDNVLAWDVTWRPLFVGFLTGLFLGDVNSGLYMGAQCEALFMGVSAIGGTTPTDSMGGTMFATMAVIQNGATWEVALTAATAMGILLNYVSSLFGPIGILMLPWYESFAEKGDVKTYNKIHWFYTLVLSLPRTITVFLISTVLANADLSVLDTIFPEWLLNGFGVAGDMMVAVGFAITANMIWSTDLCIFFFVGFALTEFMGLGTLPVTFFAVAVAWCMFSINQKIDAAKGGAGSKEEELF